MNKTYVTIGLLAIVVIGLLAWQLKPVTTTTDTMQVQEAKSNDLTIQPTAEDVQMKEASFKDGTYDGVGNYKSPAGQEEVGVTVTVKNGEIITAEFTGKATNATSKLMQEKFKEGYTKEVVGKPLSDVKLTIVNGSSLTPKGFMDALEKIKSEATQS